ncbi:uncharacterized protein EI97DRAFT_434507 [Westerdykella ornata]|uniref:Uncharacterized protein n=1 Tax=Westerdykella ornata TaxID=318751 RepID=A0A6A6JF93_WESOR|nr:uncharacterized protein EI97DRAFT_434507 [Westerdykella ornata]KAF2275290.1 hypothetical protein EI97DRAFT_434507 [Westerdykella ornata]
MRAARIPTQSYSGLFLWLLSLSGTSGFGTINEPNIIGQHCEHERITRAAFACPPGISVSDGRCFEELSLHQLAGRSGPEGYVGTGSNGAVGAPDMLDPVPEGPEAHCDNADFLDDPSYPQTRMEATAQLQDCVNHLRERFLEGVEAANKITDEESRIIISEVDISTLDCRFSFPELQSHHFSRSKCSAIEGFGRALHGIQDFYAHSNWADRSEPPFSAANPPGLERTDYPIFLDLRAENDITEQVPHNLSTGCFGGIFTDGPVGRAGHPLEPGSIDCTGRITHGTLNKDNGIIDAVTGMTSKPGPNTPRSDIPGNFERAVQGAIKDSRRLWRHFREEIRRTYGTERGNIMVCALVRDNPNRDCYGRRIAFLRDAPKDINRVAEIQIPIHRWLLEELEGKAHDEGPDEGGTPQNATKSRGSSGELHGVVKYDEDNVLPGTSQGLDISSAIDDLLIHAGTIPANKSAIIALTTNRDLHLGDSIAEVWRAGDKGVRVHLGLLPPAQTAQQRSEDKTITALSEARAEDLMTAVLRTGGTYSVLHSRRSIPRLLDHVISRGLTQYDNARDTETLLLPGLSIGDYVTPAAEPRRFSFDAHAYDNVMVAVAPITPNLALHVSVRHVRWNEMIRELRIGAGGNETFRAEFSVADIPRTDAWFELEVAHVEGTGLAGSGLFEVSMETEVVSATGDGQKATKPNAQGRTGEHDEL